MKVLIADDDPVSRRLLRGYLDRWGYQTVEAQNGAEAWRLFQGDDFPLVILDWMMPEMDGLEVVRRLRAAKLPRYVYAMLVTARAEKEDLVEGMEAGADDFLSKPFDRDELRVRLREGERIVRLERAALDDGRGRDGADPTAEIDEALRCAAADLESLRGQVAPAAAPRLDAALDRLAAARRALRRRA